MQRHLQRVPRTLLPGRQWGREQDRLPRGAAFLGSRKQGSRKKEIPGPEVGGEPEIGLCLFLKKKIRPVSKSNSAINEPVMTQLIISRIFGANERSFYS